MSSFGKALGACVAGWSLLKQDLKEKKVSASDLRFFNGLEPNCWNPESPKLNDLACEVTPYNYQEELFNKLKNKLSGEGGILVVEAATASGKTDAVVATFLSQLLEREWWLAPRLIYTQPTQALTLTTFSRLLAYSSSMHKLFEVPRLSVSIEHGATFAYKQFLYGGVMTAATLDSAVYGYVALRVPGGLNYPRLSMPAALIATSLFVLDEVQLYQDQHYYSPRVLGMILKTIVKAGGLVVILTATMPRLLLEILVQGLPYEHVIAGPIQRRNVCVDFSYLSKRTPLSGVIEDKNLINKIKDTIEGGEHVLVVTNTVELAIKVYEKLKKSFGTDNLLLLHGRLANKDKVEREGMLFSTPKIVVSTQVVEAGFDLDSGLLLTEVAPIDSLIQRAGRVGRKTKKGEVIVTAVESYAPYRRELIEKTINVLLGRQKVFEDALDDVRAAKFLLDEIYTDVLFTNEFEEPFRNASRYLSSLRLLSFPPEEEFRLREGFYISLVVPEILKQHLINKSLRYIIISNTLKCIRASKGKENELLVALEESSLLLDFALAKRLLGDEDQKQGKKKRSSSGKSKQSSPSEGSSIQAELKVVKAEDSVQLLIMEPRDGSRLDLRPFHTYLLKEGVYRSTLGLGGIV